jgi:putative FmdB family regulatory protein
MPIYAYRCSACGFEKDALQKLSDAPLTQCPQCGQETFSKQVTAAGFQLKGSGWYVTDFRGGNKPATTAPKTGEAASSGGATPAAGGDASSGAGSSAPAAGSSSSSGDKSGSSSTSSSSSSASSSMGKSE